MPVLSLIVAMDEDRVIGNEGGMPWYLPADLKHFKQTTTGKPIIMGRKTHQAIGRPLPDRRNVVLSRNDSFHAEGCETVRSLDEALELCVNEKEVMVIGGGAIYEQALSRADRLYLTRIHGHFEGDTRFPRFNHEEWDVIDVRDRPADDKNPFPMTFLELHRRRD